MIMTGPSVSLGLLLCCLPLAVVSLTCYTCVFPAISPLDCLQLPQDCPEGQRCLSSVSVGVRGSFSIVLHEKSCAIPSQCGLRGEKHAAGLNFTFENTCCDTDLCNSAVHLGAPCWTQLFMTIISISLILLFT
ncbi:sperm acrosome membrane-associated protein 4-like [Hoplias malabaricus]|uniref:sperm acrosome membrane-associated protein 4-like n=1 Tax=Hoplias malabaricus TaxID=27720 RepID=UPI003461B8AC